MPHTSDPHLEPTQSTTTPHTKGASDWHLAVVAGLACFLLSPLSVNFSIQQTRITLVWTIVFPLAVALAKGPRAGLVAGVTGGALYPFLLWPENGYANVLFVLLLFPLYVLVGSTAYHRRILGRRLPLYVRLAVVFTIYSVLTGIITYYVSNIVYALNTPYWPGRSIPSLGRKILLSISIKSFINQSLLIVLAESLLHLPAVRRLFHMHVPSYSRNNHSTFFYSIVAAGSVWGIFFLLDCLLVGSMSFRTREYIPLALMVLLWSGAVIGRVLIYSTEHRLKLRDQRVQLLHEKEILLRELHHRTNNNMQVIHSFLMLEQSFAESPDVSYHLQAVSDRIEVMSLAHKKLYQSGDLSTIPLREYLSELVAALPEKFAPGREDISIKTGFAKTMVLFDIGIPIGLVIYELVSNSLKHAFPETGGSIFVTVTADESDAMSITVRDTGGGLPEGLDLFQSETLGIQMVIAIVQRQLNGAVSFAADNGLTCSIKFRNNLYFRRV